jgi:hypothetical protein
MLSAEQRIDQTIEAGSGSEGCLRLRNKMTRSGTSCLEFSLEVRQRHIEIEHGHLGRSVADKYLAVRDGEFGYANYEIIPLLNNLMEHGKGKPQAESKTQAE